MSKLAALSRGLNLIFTENRVLTTGWTRENDTVRYYNTACCVAVRHALPYCLPLSF